MASRQGVLRGFTEDSPAAVFDDMRGWGWKTGSGSVRLILKPVSPRELLVVELPLMAILTMMFLITLIVSPGQEITAFGFNLPSLLICPVFELTGVPCLMCGITRSFLSMGGGDFSGAFVFHPLGPLFYLALIASYAALTLSVLMRRRIRISFDRRLRQWLIGSGTAVLLVAWLVKMVIWHQVGLM